MRTTAYFGLQAILSDPADEELHVLFIDLATGITTPHDIPDHVEDDEHIPKEVDLSANMTASDRANEPLPSSLT